MRKIVPFIVLGLIYITVIFEFSWAWGIFFIVWAIQGIVQKQTYLIGIVSRQTHPVLYWITIVTWFVLAGYFLMELVL